MSIRAPTARTPGASLPAVPVGVPATARAGRALSTLVDIVRIVFFVYATLLTGQMMSKMSNYNMTIVDLPMNVVYAVCLFGFACSAIRAVQVAVEHWRQGYSVLERPEIAIDGSI